MHFEGEFSVPGKPAEVIRRFADVPRMARCMPGAVLEPQAEDGSWPGGMVVSFGPKKIKFKGRASCEFDFDGLTGIVHGRGTADMRAARIGVKVGFTLRDDPAASSPTTIVKVVSDAELGGVLADFARTGGVAVANVIMADFARRAAAEFAKDDAPAAASAASPEQPAAEQTAAASAAESGQPAPEQTATAQTSLLPTASDLLTSVMPQPAASPAPPAGSSASAAPAFASPAAAPAAATPPKPAAARPAATPYEPAPAVPLAAHTLLWAVIKAQFAQFARWLGLRR